MLDLDLSILDQDPPATAAFFRRRVEGGARVAGDRNGPGAAAEREG